jgi:hypothetical protein
LARCTSDGEFADELRASRDCLLDSTAGICTAGAQDRNSCGDCRSQIAACGSVATRALDVTGAYPLTGYAPNVDVPHGVQVVDGADGGRKAVREQLMHGADWIKVYSDRSYRLRDDGVLDDIPTFTLDELRAIVDETHRQRQRSPQLGGSGGGLDRAWELHCE